MKNKRLSMLFSLIGGTLLVLALLIVLGRPADVGADAVTNYYTRQWLAGTTTYITTGGQTAGFDVSRSNYQMGQAVVHLIADASATTSTFTVYPQYSNETVNCTAAANWFTGTDYIPYSAGATYYVPIQNTVNTTSSLAWTSSGSTTITGSMPYVVTTTYSYGSATQLGAAATGYNSVVQSMATTGDQTIGRDFVIYGRCMRLKFTVSYGTVTPTIYVQERDFYE